MAGHESVRTVDGDCDAFGQDEAIGANESWDSGERVQFEIFGVDIWGTGLDEFNVEVVLLRNH
jgi:hypothetical protein